MCIYKHNHTHYNKAIKSNELKILKIRRWKYMNSKASWIKAREHTDYSCPVFYTGFTSRGGIKSAVLSISAVGMYNAYINGRRVGDALFAPGWTEYEKRIQYQEYDVTDMIVKSNELCIVCAEGWAAGTIGYSRLRNSFSDHISVIFSLEITYDNDDTELIVSDENTKIRTSHIVSTGIYEGETVDMTAEITELGTAVYDEVGSKLVPQQGEFVKEQEVIRPVKYIVTPKGEKVIDFGQNLAGYVEITASGERGSRIRISHAEVLDRDGNFYTENLRSAKQENVYILSGSGTETFKPSFTWQGFRYIRIDEYPSDDITLDSFRAIAVNSDMRRTGYFSCGNEKINQLYHNIIWGQKGNYIDVPTDCPQRDERLGWTGDAQVFVRTAAINFNVERFFKKWLADLALSQGANGEVYGIAPLVKLDISTKVSAAWGDAAVICPWEIYLAYGDKSILEAQFESMRRWIEYMHGAGSEEFLWLGGNHYGDWLAMDGDDYVGATPPDYIASAFFARSTSLFIKSGRVLGRDMRVYEELYKNIVSAFRSRFIDSDGTPVPKTQTSYVLALHFDLCSDRRKTLDELAAMIRSNGTRLTTGFVGTPYLLHVLSDGGMSGLAYDLLFQDQSPSWLFSVDHGATTMWEHWDGIKEDGSFWSSDMNSYNHYAYGAVYDWIFGNAAGIKVLEDGAGYSHISIKPIPDSRLGFVNASIDTRLGRVSSGWHIKDDTAYFEIEIPENTTAEITLPDGSAETVTGGKYMYSSGM